MSVATVVSTAPVGMLIPKSICNAIAPPNISASEVEMLAKIALTTMGRPAHLGEYLTQAGYNAKMGHIVLKGDEHNR